MLDSQLFGYRRGAFKAVIQFPGIIRNAADGAGSLDASAGGLVTKRSPPHPIQAHLTRSSFIGFPRFLCGWIFLGRRRSLVGTNPGYALILQRF